MLEFDDDDDSYATDAPEQPDLGPCCCCGSSVGARNIVMLSKRASIPGTGWGCLICGLPADGAVYIACDACLETHSWRLPVEVVKGDASSKGRQLISELSDERFDHDLSIPH